MSKIFISEIYIYPIKSLGGIKLKSSDFEERGLQYDRRYMLVNNDNKFITQREFSQMSLISVEISDNSLICNVPNQNKLIIPLNPDTKENITVNVWRSFCNAQVYSKEINEWFSNFLKTEVKLVYMPDSTKREVNPDYSIKNDIVSFADGYPFLLASQTSLDDLNSKLDKKIDMNRFRPNFVINGADAFIEDSYKNITIGKNKFFIVKPCERCVITTIEQTTGISDGKEPLKTLSTYRKINNKIIFGQNLIPEKSFGTVNIGDEAILT
jgi:uncharacterized protein YcbX